MSKLGRDHLEAYSNLQGIGRRARLAILRGVVKRAKRQIDALDNKRKPLIAEHNQAMVEIAALENGPERMSVRHQEMRVAMESEEKEARE